MDINILKALVRINYSDDGSYLIDYLRIKSKENYKRLKACSDSTMQSILIGRAQVFDEIEEILSNADDIIKESTDQDVSGWSL